MLSHFTAVKRILRYLKGTLHVGISYTKGDLQLKAFNDANWAGDPNDRRSTTGLVIDCASKVSLSLLFYICIYCFYLGFYNK